MFILNWICFIGMRLRATLARLSLLPSTALSFQVFMWDRSSVTLAKCRNLKYVKDKFQGSPDMIKGLCGSFIDSHLIIFR